MGGGKGISVINDNLHFKWNITSKKILSQDKLL